ncbi:MAG: adenosylhomocysteine nucleosidase [Acidobacteriaceae bacterium]|jgi:adenosylhomocysteine nucleosidase
MSTPRIAIVAALDREVRPLVKNWTSTSRVHEGRSFKFFEHESWVVVCGGIGENAARRATEAVIALYHPLQVMSAGFAGALDSKLRVGDIFVPGRVLDARDCSTAETITGGDGILVSISTIAGIKDKAKLSATFGARAVDMEAAAVARGAQARGIPFSAVKAISDEADFEIPAMNGLVSDGAMQGQFRTGKFAAFALIRPWMWPSLIALARNSSKASRTLCSWLAEYDPKLRIEDPQSHLITAGNALK